MVEIYVKTNTDYNKNGDITLTPTSCTYKDSEKELVLEHIQDKEGRWKYIEFENVIAAEENEIKKLYRIYNVVKSLNSITAYARPIFYDLIDKVLLDVRPTEKNGQEALNIILADTGFKGHSNILSLNTAYYVRKNIVEALIGDANNAFINRWGGEFYCENFDIYINHKVGSDNGVKVEFGYNLNEIEENVNIEDVVTRIIPVGYDGIMLEGESPWVDSPLINKYTHVKSRIVEFSNIKVKESSEDEEGFNTIEEARAEMIKQCKLLFENGIDKPSINYKIDMINLANTTEYEHLKMLVNVNKGDTVTCYIKHLDIDVKARVIDYEKDLLTGEYISIELGNIIDNFFDNQADIQHKVDNIFNDNGNIKAETLEGAINALQTKFEALRDVAQPQSVRAILFEDRIEDSPTFGCMCLGTMGFEIAGSFKPGTKDWDFRTFGTGKGFVADHIITGVLNAALIKAGTLESENTKTWINMEDGTFNFSDKVKFDGENFTIDLSGEDLAENESIKAVLQIMNDAISSKVSNGEFQSYVEQTDKKIASKVSNDDFESYKEQTAEHIKTEVKNTKEELESRIEQTAESITLEVKNNKDELKSKIEQTADSIKLEIKNVKEGLQSQIEQNKNDIDKDIADIQDQLEGVIGDIGGALTDGIIDELEMNIIKDRLVQFNKEKDDITMRYNNLYSNSSLSGTAKSNLKAKYDLFITKHNSLVKTINDIIADKKATEAERQAFTAAVKEYNAVIPQLSKAFDDALNCISKNTSQSLIEQTADSIKLEVKNVKEGLESSIKQTADAIYTKVSSVENKITASNGDVSDLVDRIESAEQKITATAITSTISSAINNGSGKIETTQFVMDKKGFTINNGGLTIKNKAGTTVLNSDTKGNLVLSGTVKSQNGDQYVAMNSGGIDFKDHHLNEQLMRVGCGYFSGNRDQNGINFALAQCGDYVRFSHIKKDDLTNGWSNTDSQYIFMDMWHYDITIGNSKYKKGVTMYAPLYINDGIRLNYKGSENTQNVVTSSAWNGVTGMLGLYGDNGTCIGYQEGNNLMSRIVVTEAAHPGTDDHIKSWGNWNCSGYTVHSATFAGKFVNTYANTLTKTFTETHCIEAENKQIRVNFSNVQLKNGKAILNIPKRYVNINTGYTVASIVKKGKGDVWVAEELENRFIIEGTEGIKINVEVIIHLEDESLYTSTAKTIDDQQLCINMSTGQPIGA